MNTVQLLGRLARDPEFYAPKTKDGTAVCRFTLAVQRDKETADFISCTAFGQTAEVIDQHCRKGQRIAVTGRIQTGSYTSKDGDTIYTTDVIINRLFFAGDAPKDAEEAPKKPAAYASRSRK